MTERKLLDTYGRVALAGNASVFIGAAVSQSAGYPGWGTLLEEPRRRANIPDEINDLPLVAQYIARGQDERKALDSHILTEMSKIKAEPTSGHHALARIPVADIWTTNYDCLLERAIPHIRVVTSDKDLTERGLPVTKRLIKMHGSLTDDDQPGWRTPPVITRSDYEKYEMLHPRIWAALTAAYLTRSFLFLGFSFTDPNVEILLRLARTLLNVGAPEHFTVLKRPSGINDRRLHDLKADDLEASGIAVCEVSDYKELAPLLGRLVRRTREPILFISGSAKRGGESDRIVGQVAQALGRLLAETPVQIVSLGAGPGKEFSFSLGEALLQRGNYEPGNIRFSYQQHAERHLCCLSVSGRQCIPVRPKTSCENVFSPMRELSSY